jgi:hypothetical protein
MKVCFRPLLCLLVTTCLVRSGGGLPSRRLQQVQKGEQQQVPTAQPASRLHATGCMQVLPCLSHHLVGEAAPCG